KIKNLITGNDRTTLEIESHLDVSTGDIICKIDDRAQLSDQFRINLLWQDEAPLLPSRPYLLKMGERVVAASITDIRHIVNSQTLEQDAAKIMRLNETGACNLAVAGPIPYDPFEENRITGCFTLLDRESHQTVATGTIQYGLYRADNIHWQALGIDKAARSNMKEQKPAVLWFTGLSASGKSTIANLVEQKLHEAGRHTYTLDGDNVRHGLNKNLGFTDADRVENIRRVAETSKLMIDAGLICLVSFISPFRAERRMARELMEDGEFIEVFVDAPLEVCEARDPKGLYKKARAGEIKNFTGFDSPYEAPEHAEIVIPTAEMNPDEAAENIIGYLRGQRLVGQ
ncbi:MAG TPA: adenylyl-sulfate kinase, partial [Rhodospirillales bacterium]|nr:adenylyl-sulfate kinase [Rhodospirillales bacterium]